MVSLLQEQDVPDVIRSLFVPSKPVNEMTDQDVADMPGVKVLRNLTGLPDDDALPLARQLLEASWQHCASIAPAFVGNSSEARAT